MTISSASANTVVEVAIWTQVGRTRIDQIFHNPIAGRRRNHISHPAGRGLSASLTSTASGRGQAVAPTRRAESDDIVRNLRDPRCSNTSAGRHSASVSNSPRRRAEHRERSARSFRRRGDSRYRYPLHTEGSRPTAGRSSGHVEVETQGPWRARYSPRTISRDRPDDFHFADGYEASESGGH